MDFLKNLGFDPILLGAQLLNFLIIFYLLKRFLYKPVLDTIKKRQDTIENGLKQTAQAEETLAKTIEQEKKILAKAQEEAKAIIEDAKLNALNVSKEIEENTKQQSDRMIVQAKQIIEQESQEAEKRITKNITVIASDLLTKSLEGIFSDKEQKQIINKTLKNLKKSN